MTLYLNCGFTCIYNTATSSGVHIKFSDEIHVKLVLKFQLRSTSAYNIGYTREGFINY